MKRLREAFEILAKYNDDCDLNAHHDVIYIMGPEPHEMDNKDVDRLGDLGCHFDSDDECWYRFV